MTSPVIDTVVAGAIFVRAVFDQPLSALADPGVGFTLLVDGLQRAIDSAELQGDSVLLMVGTIQPDNQLQLQFDNSSPNLFDLTGTDPAVSFTQQVDNQSQAFYAGTKLYAPALQFDDGHAVPRVEIELSRRVRDLLRRFGRRTIDPQVAYSGALGSLTVNGSPSVVGEGTVVRAVVTNPDMLLTTAAAQEWQTQVVDRLVREFAALELLAEKVDQLLNPPQSTSI